MLGYKSVAYFTMVLRGGKSFSGKPGNEAERVLITHRSGNSPCSDVSSSHDPKLRANRVRVEQRSHMVSLQGKHLASPRLASPHHSHRLMDEQRKRKSKKSNPPRILSACHPVCSLGRQLCIMLDS